MQSLWQPLVSQEEGGSGVGVGIQLPVQVVAHFLTSLETRWGRRTLQGGGKDGLDTGGRPELGGGIDASNRYLLALLCAGQALWSQGQDRASPCPEETYTMVGRGEMSECIGDNIVSGHVSK